MSNDLKDHIEEVRFDGLILARSVLDLVAESAKVVRKEAKKRSRIVTDKLSV